MLEVLLESRGVHTPRPLFEATISALTHGALLVVIVAGPSMNSHFEYRLKTSTAITPPEYLVPPDRASPPQQEHVRFIAVGGQAADRSDASEPRKNESESSAANPDDETMLGVERAQLVDNAYSVIDVDSAAVRDPTSAAPAYPPAMMSLNIEGTAMMKFVVDTSGRVDLGTVQTIAATNPAFAHAVLDALPKMRFHPARMGSTAVRQLAMEEFKFQLKRIAAGRP